MKKEILIWIAGIIAAILGGVGTYYLTRPPAVTTFEGMVYSGSDAVPNAFVELDLTGAPAGSGTYHDETDPQGSYRIELTGLNADVSASLRVTVKGYRSPGPQLFPKVAGQDVRYDFGLDPLAAAAPPPPPPAPGAQAPAAAPAVPPAAVQQRLPLPRYVPKLAQQAARFKIPAA